MPPTSSDGHGEQQFGQSGWSHQYATFTTDVVGSGPTSLHYRAVENNPEPDGCCGSCRRTAGRRKATSLRKDDKK